MTEFRMQGPRSQVRPQRRWKSLRHEVHDSSAAAVRADRLSAGYGTVPAIVDVSFELQTGNRLAVVGPNGAGKSTLLMAVAGLLEPMAGEVRIHGHGPCRHICIAYVPQRNVLDWRFPLTVADFVMLGRTRRIGPWKRPQAQDRARVRDALHAVGLAAEANHRIEALSGGQQQRLFMARALAQQAELILLDEPLVGLDVHTHREVLDLVLGMRERDVTVMMSLHDLSLAALHFDRLLLLRRRVIGFGQPQEVLTEEALRQAYGGCLHVVSGDGGAFIVNDTACSGGDPSA